MNYVKFLVALAAICVLIIPAFSMPDNGIGKDANQMWQGQEGKQISQGQDNTQKTCGCQNCRYGLLLRQRRLDDRQLHQPRPDLAIKLTKRVHK